MGNWGIVDVNDCCSCARFLVIIIILSTLSKFQWMGNHYPSSRSNVYIFIQVDSGKADEERLCITGGSAGGYTTLAALAFRDIFKAGASLYGVSNRIYTL